MFRFSVVILLLALSHHCYFGELLAGSSEKQSRISQSESIVPQGNRGEAPLHDHHSDTQHGEHDHGQLHRIVALQGKAIIVPVGQNYMMLFSFLILSTVFILSQSKSHSFVARLADVISNLDLSCRVHSLAYAPQAPPASVK